MTTLAHKKVSPITAPSIDIRTTLTKHRTATIDNFVFDKVTGEILASYTRSDYSPEPIAYSVASAQEDTRFVITEDGSPFATHFPVVTAGLSTPILSFPKVSVLSRPKAKAGKGRKAQIIKNGLFELMWAAKIEDVRQPWLDDVVQGAINTGPGVINGKYSVSPADVTKLLYQSEISVESAATCLLNHDHEPMSVRQVQRVVEAARVALRGIALYFECHKEILLQLDVEIDFSQFWRTTVIEKTQRTPMEHPKRQEVLLLLEQGEAINAISRQTHVSKTTIKKWKAELEVA